MQRAQGILHRIDPQRVDQAVGLFLLPELQDLLPQLQIVQRVVFQEQRLLEEHAHVELLVEQVVNDLLDLDVLQLLKLLRVLDRVLHDDLVLQIKTLHLQLLRHEHQQLKTRLNHEKVEWGFRHF